MRTTSHLEWEEFKRLLRYTKEHNKMICLFSAISTYCGLRLSDTTQLRWGDMEKEMIVLKEQKTGKVRKIPVHPELWEILIELRTEENLDSHYIFANRFGNPYSRVHINYELQRCFKEACLKYRGNVSSHLFRKTLGRRVLNTQKDKEFGLILLQDIFKHSSQAVTKRYLGIREDEINSAYLGI
ncbi:MAG: tyrosine-type recombinase/integrase [Candidatus Pacearchaeota archaeon]